MLSMIRVISERSQTGERFLPRARFSLIVSFYFESLHLTPMYNYTLSLGKDHQIPV